MNKISLNRFEKCEEYKDDNSICDDVYEVSVDYVFVPTRFGSQQNIAMILEGNIPSSLQLGELECRDHLYQIICHYYLSPCGFETPPTSISPNDCNMIQELCLREWNVLEQRLSDYDFIRCDDTKALLFPLPSCCTEIGQLIDILTTNGSLLIIDLFMYYYNINVSS